MIRQLIAVSILFVACANVSAAELSLNGDWQIAYDQENVGKTKEWYLDEKYPTEATETIRVPSSWELYRKNYEGVAWYRKTFTVSERHKGRSIRLQFDAVNYLTSVYLNGVAVGFHEGGYTPFEFTVDDLVKYGETNTLIVRVTSPVVVREDLDQG